MRYQHRLALGFGLWALGVSLLGVPAKMALRLLLLILFN